MSHCRLRPVMSLALALWLVPCQPVPAADMDGAVDYICRQLKDAVLRRNTQFKKDQM